MPSWQTISDNPSAPELLGMRALMTKKAFAGFVPDRVAYLVSLAKGKRVLDIGVVDHTPGEPVNKGRHVVTQGDCGCSNGLSRNRHP